MSYNNAPNPNCHKTTVCGCENEQDCIDHQLRAFANSGQYVFAGAKPKPIVIPDALTIRDAQITLLEKYSKFLQDRGYLDTDWNSEPPYAIDEFLKTLK